MKKVLMIGPGRRVRGGISSVVNSYYDLGIENDIDIKYISTMEDGGFIKKLLVAGLAYARFCASVKRYDIVHVHMAAQASFTRKSIFIKRAKKSGARVVLHCHAADFDEYYFNQSDDKNRQKIQEVFALADRVIALSEEWAEFFGKNICSREKITIIYNGVCLPEAKKTDYSDCNVLMLGRLCERKGTYDLIKAARQMINQVPKAVFYLCGDGDIDDCRDLAEKCGVGDRVKFMGWVTGREKRELFEKCSVFTLPSYHEGMPMAVLEAMSHGLATVSTNAGGLPQMIEHGKDGFRINAGDINELSGCITTLLKDAELKKSVGQNAAQKIKEKFDVKQSYNRLLQIYGEV